MIGDRILMAIKASGRTQRDVAQAIGMSPAAINSAIKTGSISSSNLLTLSKELGRSMEWFLTGEDVAEVAVPMQIRQQIAALVELFCSRKIDAARIDEVIGLAASAAPGHTIRESAVHYEIEPVVTQLERMLQRRTLQPDMVDSIASMLRAFERGMHLPPADVKQRLERANASLANTGAPELASVNWRGKRQAT
ncbi:helix-turn-helix domain-containing protein [Chitinimonas sp.]|uniref:helix-turn-helix domain-containing protein n=1 Tax=Chitinimonas sp. TaxID=1934313 RepID=UPI0035AFAB34